MDLLSESEIIAFVGTGILPPSNAVQLRAGGSPPLQIRVLPGTTSTNTEMFNLAKEGAPEGTVILADQQTAGRGRLDRTWESPPGKSLYFSILLRPTLSPAAALPLTLVTGVACYEALQPIMNPLPTVRARQATPLQLKWPNDLLVDSKKLGGILTEMEAEEGQVKFVVVGIGLNINSVPEDFSDELRPWATSLFLETQTPHSRNEIAGRVLKSFFEHYQIFLKNGFEPLQKKWEAYARMKGQRVKVTEGHRSFEGICEGLDNQGFLLIKTSSGTQKVVAGDVMWL